MMAKQQLFIFSFAMLIVSTFLTLCFLGIAWFIHLPVFSIKEINVYGDLQHVTRAQIEQKILPGLSGNFFTMNLDKTRQTFQKLPWVRSVELYRYWPNRLDVKLVEHVAFARWNESKLLNTYGEVFDVKVAPSDFSFFPPLPRGEGPGVRETGMAPKLSFFGAVITAMTVEGKFEDKNNLPSLKGPEGSEEEVMQSYLRFKSSVTSLDLSLQQVALSKRHAWQLRLTNGLIIELGRDQPSGSLEQRWTKFLLAYEEIAQRADHQFSYVDLRYPNGFAVKAKKLITEEVELI